jgi:hypothetical protein
MRKGDEPVLPSVSSTSDLLRFKGGKDWRVGSVFVPVFTWVRRYRSDSMRCEIDGCEMGGRGRCV